MRRRALLAMATGVFDLVSRQDHGRRGDFALADAAEAHRALESRKTVSATVRCHEDAHAAAPAGAAKTYRQRAWFAFAMTMGLMLFDYIDRQVIVSLFPPSRPSGRCRQTASLVSVVSISDASRAASGAPTATAA
jgi:hypothetical protein